MHTFVQKHPNMMKVKNKKIKLFCFILVLVAFLMFVTAFATPYFIEIKYSTGVHNAGLWKYCKPVSGKTTCINTEIEVDLPYVKVCQAMSIMALVYGIVGVVSMGLRLFCFQEKMIWQIIAIVTMFAVVFYSLVPVGLFLFYTNAGLGKGSKLGYSFIICVLGEIIAVISSIVMIIDLLCCKKVRVNNATNIPRREV
ncbi:LIM2 [Mytilus edulis]|uniref:LIM2 n=1 Tax=Mytilus edulis TaxID=6550 RepID=A0A8S3RJC4_MYTED|nr:LIM2 [Mytilus edulis]